MYLSWWCANGGKSERFAVWRCKHNILVRLEWNRVFILRIEYAWSPNNIIYTRIRIAGEWKCTPRRSTTRARVHNESNRIGTEKVCRAGMIFGKEWVRMKRKTVRSQKTDNEIGSLLWFERGLCKRRSQPVRFAKCDLQTHTHTSYTFITKYGIQTISAFYFLCFMAVCASVAVTYEWHTFMFFIIFLLSLECLHMHQ